MANGEPKLTDQVVLRLREMILRGDLRGGERVAEIPIAKRLGVSRTPVREALTVLAQEGLLDVAGKRGYQVMAFYTSLYFHHHQPDTEGAENRRTEQPQPAAVLRNDFT
jgi:DNA-binding GntR family transcriptional regulator